MKLAHLITFTASVCAVLSGCAATTPFPPEVMDKVTPTFQFEAWRDAGPTNESGKSDSGIKVLLGGRIVQDTKDSKGIGIVAEQLPIVNHPAYGPIDEIGTRTGDPEFAFIIAGGLDSL